MRRSWALFHHLLFFKMKSFYRPQATFKKLNNQQKAHPFRQEWEDAQRLPCEQRWDKEMEIIEKAAQYYKGKISDKALKSFDCMEAVITGVAFRLGWGFCHGFTMFWKPTKRKAIEAWNACNQYEHHGWGDGPFLGEIERETLPQNMLAGMP